MECKDCKTIRQADIGFADPRLTYTKALERYVLDLAKHMAIVDVSRHLGLSWDIIKGIQKRYLQKKLLCQKMSDSDASFSYSGSRQAAHLGIKLDTVCVRW